MAIFIMSNEGPYSVRKMTGGLEPIHIVAKDGATIIATVHKDKGYEDRAAKMAAGLNHHDKLVAFVHDTIFDFDPGDAKGPPCGPEMAQRGMALLAEIEKG